MGDQPDIVQEPGDYLKKHTVIIEWTSYGVITIEGEDAADAHDKTYTLLSDVGFVLPPAFRTLNFKVRTVSQNTEDEQTLTELDTSKPLSNNLDSLH